MVVTTNNYNNRAKSGPGDYLVRVRNCFPRDSRFEIYVGNVSNEIIVRDVKDLPGYVFRIAGPREKTGYVAQLPEDVVSIIVPPLNGKAQSTLNAHPIYPIDHIEMAIVEVQKRIGGKEIPKSKEVSIDTLCAWLHDHVSWRGEAITKMVEIENYGHIFVETVTWGNNGYNKSVGYITTGRYPGRTAMVINTRENIDNAPERIAELVRALNIDNKRNS